MALADEAATETHAITIGGALDGETYTAYKLMDATYDKEDDVLGTNYSPISIGMILQCFDALMGNIVDTDSYFLLY